MKVKVSFISLCSQISEKKKPNELPEINRRKKISE